MLAAAKIGVSRTEWSLMTPRELAFWLQARREHMEDEARGQRRNDRLVGTVREVLAEGPSKRNAARWSGRDSGNRIVVWDVAEGCRETVGARVKLRITAAHPQILVGKTVH